MRPWGFLKRDPWTFLKKNELTVVRFSVFHDMSTHLLFSSVLILYKFYKTYKRFLRVVF